MAKDKGGHGSEKRGGDYAKSASGKPGYNPIMQGGKRMFGRQPTAAEAAANSANVKAFSALAGAPSNIGPRQAAMARLEASGKIPAGTLQSVATVLGAGAHSAGVQAVGQPPSIDRQALNKTYNRNENNNAHSANIALLAKNFGTPGEHAQAKEIMSERNRIGQLPSSTKTVSNVRDWQYGIHQKYIGQLMGNKP